MSQQEPPSDPDSSSSKPTAEAVSAPAEGHVRAGLPALTLGSVGVVYGDIGTSPLYAFREALGFAARDGLATSEVFGVVSLIIWALIIVVTLKYVLLMLRLDNQGEGGILSLLALVIKAVGRKPALMVTAIIGASLFYGDSIITPAISVLSAIEGLSFVHAGFGTFVLPITSAVLIALFWVQRRGTGAVARWFGPIMLIWFLTLAGMGLYWIIQMPVILQALSPHYAVHFLINNAGVAAIVVGLVFLAVTGAEALYADLGHFGRKPIQLAWFFIVFPALSLNYMGQGALVLAQPDALENAFLRMAPDWALIPLVLLATLATVIASQAVISGAFSLTRQAIQLGLLPRLAIRHTSAKQQGQIYIPAINGLLFFGVIILVWEFGSSKALASAYGIAVTGDMVVTSILAFMALRYYKKLPLWTAGLIVLPFLLIELAFLGSNALKIAQGGYVPLMVAAVLGVIMWSWLRGTALVRDVSAREDVSLDTAVRLVTKSAVARASGVAVYMSPYRATAPAALMHNFKHNHVIHETNVIITVIVENVPRVKSTERLVVNPINDCFVAIDIHCGYMETANIPQAMRELARHGIKTEPMLTSYFLSRRTVTRARVAALPVWQTAIYILLSRLASRATDYFRIPANRVVELGQQVEI